MASTIDLQNHFSLSVTTSDVHHRVEGNHVFFSLDTNANRTFSNKEKLFEMPFPAVRTANVIGDGFQMLAQTAGTIDEPVDVGRCPDNNDDYRIYDKNAPKRYYNTLTVEDAQGYLIFGFTSCRRFAGFFEVTEREGQLWLAAYLDGEDSHTSDWGNSELESIAVLKGESLAKLQEEYASLIAENHPARDGVTQNAPVGWCSWYAYYAEVTENNVIENVNTMNCDLKDLEWVLLDDGYQAFMGDWLSPSDKFSGGVKDLIHDIKARGKKPAIWMAPFIAQPESEVFRNHPDWFVKHNDNSQLKADDITYGGWRCTPWYILDTSNPEVQEHLTRVVKVMREEWGVELFKLDANYWGTLKGKRSQAGVTGVEAYRLGMEAIAKGAGSAWILGCNAPMWPSLGLVDAMRVSDDVERDAHRFEQIAKETFYRSWQHRRLWQIDPDCATFTNLPNQATGMLEYEFHRNVLLACGGMLLSGDPLPVDDPMMKANLGKLISRQKRNQATSDFSSLSLSHSFLELDELTDLHCVFNYADNDEQSFTLTSENMKDWYDYWTGKKLTIEPCRVLHLKLEKGLGSRAVIARAIRR